MNMMKTLSWRSLSASSNISFAGGGGAGGQEGLNDNYDSGVGIIGINFTDDDSSSSLTTMSSSSSSVSVSSSFEGTSDCYSELFQGYSSGLLTFASATCIIFILLGVPGNLITIIALARCKKVRNATAVFIINLSLSDLLFCCFNLPLASSNFWQKAWCHGELICRLFPLMRYGLLAVSLFTILAITINRYVMIGHPRIYPRIYRHRYLGIMVASTWVCAFGTLIPTWRGAWGQFGLDRDIGSCTIISDKNGTNPKEFLFIMAFIVPCISIVVCYARIFYIVRKTALRSHEPILTSASVRLISGKTERSNTQDTNHSDRQLIEKSSRTSKDENSENSSSISNSSGYPQSIHQIISQSSSVTANQHHHQQQQLNQQQQPQQQHHSRLPARPYLSKLKEDEIKFIDTSVENDFPIPPSTQLSTLPLSTAITSLKKDRSNTKIEENLFNVTAIKLPNGGTTTITVHQKTINETDSAVEDSTSSSDNNQVFHITPTTDTSNQFLSVQVEPSSSSGVELPLDHESPPRKRIFKKSLKASINRMAKRPCRKTSTVNTSGASILYPGRMTQKDRRLLKMILVIFLSFVICYLPITITKIWRNVTEFHLFNIMGYLLIYLTTCINPIIYVVMSSEYRQAYWNLLLCRTMTSRQNNNGGGGVGGGGVIGTEAITKNESKPKLLSHKT